MERYLRKSSSKQPQTSPDEALTSPLMASPPPPITMTSNTSPYAILKSIEDGGHSLHQQYHQLGGSQAAYNALKSGGHNLPSADSSSAPAHLIRPSASGFSPYYVSSQSTSGSQQRYGATSPPSSEMRSSSYQAQQEAPVSPTSGVSCKVLISRINQLHDIGGV